MEIILYIAIVLIGSTAVLSLVKYIAKRAKEKQEMSVKENLENKLADLDRELAEYREKKSVSGTREYEDARNAEEILAKSFSFGAVSEEEESARAERIANAIVNETFNPIEKRAQNAGLGGMKVSFTPVVQKDL